MRQAKKYRLRASKNNKPQKHALLSGVVRVISPDGPGYAYIYFDESFVDAVGKALPRGLSPTDPGYLKLIYMPGIKMWRLFAMYLREERGVLLWETEKLPSWVGKVVQR